MTGIVLNRKNEKFISYCSMRDNDVDKFVERASTLNWEKTQLVNEVDKINQDLTSKI